MMAFNQVVYQNTSEPRVFFRRVQEPKQFFISAKEWVIFKIQTFWSTPAKIWFGFQKPESPVCPCCSSPCEESTRACAMLRVRSKIDTPKRRSESSDSSDEEAGQRSKKERPSIYHQLRDSAYYDIALP